MPVIVKRSILINVQLVFGLKNDNILDGTGEDWIECACGRWVHKNCVDYDVVDASGRERMCPHRVLYTQRVNSVLYYCKQ